MASLNELKTRIASVQDTMKITNAMYMISNNKMRKARKAWQDTLPYFDTLESVLALALRHLPDEDAEHPFFDSRPEIPAEERKTGYIVITGDKGLAGAYHQNIFKLLEKSLKSTPNNQIFVVGQVGVHYLRQRKIPFDVNFMYTAQDPTLVRARDMAYRVFQAFHHHMLDDVYIIYTKMINSVTMETTKTKVLPLEPKDVLETADPIHTEFELYPTPRAVVNTVVPDYTVGEIYSAMVEAYCSEQNSRVMAMENATDSAKDILSDLKLEYNRVRQASITQEITEIAAGARAQQKGKS